MLLLDQVEVVVDLVGIHFGGNLVEVDCQLGKMPGVVGERTRAFPGDGNFLAELLVKFTETCYIRTGCLDKVFFFFMIEMDLMIDYKRYTLSGSFENYHSFSATLYNRKKELNN